MSVKVPYGHDDDGAEHQAEMAERGRRYCCPDCKGPLILKRGTKRVAHFAHQVGPVICDFINETEQHLRAKQRIVEGVKNQAPVTFLRRCGSCQSYIPMHLPSYITQASMEYTLPTGHRADVALLDGQGNLKAILEVFHAHEVGPEKAAALDEAGIRWAEVEAHEILSYAECRGTPWSWMMKTDRLAQFPCKNCRRIAEEQRRKAEEKQKRQAQINQYKSFQPFLGDLRERVTCPARSEQEVDAVTSCGGCDYFLDASKDGVACYGGIHATV